MADRAQDFLTWLESLDLKTPLAEAGGYVADRAGRLNPHLSIGDILSTIDSLKRRAADSGQQLAGDPVEFFRQATALQAGPSKEAQADPEALLASPGGSVGVSGIGKIASRTRPTVKGPTLAQPFPEIYADPRASVERAAAQRAPESSALEELFGVTRTDLDRMTLEKQNPALASLIYEPKRPPAHVEQITVPGNVRRLTDVLELASEEPRLAGSYGWYMNDPLLERFVNELGPTEGPLWYDKFHQMGAAYSPRSAVPREIERSSEAYSKARQGKLEDIYADPSQMKAHTGAVRRMEETGSFVNPDPQAAPKTRVYYDSRTGQNYFFPTQDAHFMRAIGAPDVRPFVTGPRGFGPNVESVTATESLPLGEWFARDVASPLGMTGSPAQALMWNALGPATGVTTPLSAPLLELFANQVKKAATRKGIPAEDALRQWIRGAGDKLGLNEQEVDDLREKVKAA